jgi:hypothetical protein
VTDTDHRVDIIAYRDELQQTLAEVNCDRPSDGVLDDEFLEVIVWRRTDDFDGYIVEFLITFGGPTVRLTYDSRWAHAELMHSWGKDPNTNADRQTIEFDGATVVLLIERLGILDSSAR